MEGPTGLPLDILRDIALRCDGKRLIQLEASDRALWQSPILEPAWRRAFGVEYGEDAGLAHKWKSWREAYLTRKATDRNRANGVFMESSIGVIPGGCPPICCLIHGDDLIVAAQGRSNSQIQDFQIQIWSLSNSCLVHTMSTGWGDTSPMANMSVLATNLVVGRENGQVALWRLPHIGTACASKKGVEAEWTLLFNKSFSGTCGINGTSVCCTDVSVLSAEQLLPWKPRSHENRQGDRSKKVVVVMVVQQIAAYWVVLLSQYGEILSMVLLETQSLCFCKGCGMLSFPHAVNLDNEIRMRPGSWEALASLSSSKFWEVVGKHSHKVSKKSWVIDRFQNTQSPFRVVNKYFLQDGFLVRYAIFPRMGPAHLNLRVVWGELPQCGCDYLSKDRASSNILPSAQGWCFDLLPGEECVDARSNGSGGHLVLTRSLDKGCTFAGTFRVWHAQTASIIGTFDMLTFIESGCLQNKDCEITSNLLRKHSFHAEGRFLAGTGNEILAALELNGCNYSISVEIWKMIGFWNFAKEECTNLSLGNARRAWCNWKWLVFEKQDSSEAFELRVRNFAQDP